MLWLSLKRCGFICKGGEAKLNPTRAGPSPSGSLRSNSINDNESPFAGRKSRWGYAARVAGQPGTMKGPGEDSSGGVAFRPGWWARFPNLLKPSELIQLSRLPVLGYGSRTIKVSGEVAWTQWQTTLTDENPTSSTDARGERPRASTVTPIHKSMTKGAAEATERHGLSDPRRLGMAASPEYSARHRKRHAEERRHRWKG